MDPQVRNFLAVVNNARTPPIDQVPIEQARDQFSKLTPIFHPHVPVARIEDLTTESGVALRVYHPRSTTTGPLPVIMYFHGGGWVMGSIETHDTLCRHLANHSECAVVSVDYRLAPEHKFPAALDDAWEATLHVVGRAAGLGLAPDRLCVAGDSAGGNLALAVAMKSRDQSGPEIALQCLLYPVLDSRCDTRSYSAYGEEHGLTGAKMRFFWDAYVEEHHRTHPAASPIFATDLGGLPPTILLTAEFDVLHDEGAELAHRLGQAGNEVSYLRCEGMIHGFIHFAGAIERGQFELARLGKQIGERLRSRT